MGLSMKHKTRKSLMLTWILSLVAGMALAQEHTRVLFIGNSYTQANDLPQMVADIAQSMGEALDSMGTLVHEECHRFTDTDGTRFNNVVSRYMEESENIYVGGGEYILVPMTDVFYSSEMVNVIPDTLKTYRFETYVNGDTDMASIQFGPYGLLDEFTAYCWGQNDDNRMLDYMEDYGLDTGGTANNYLAYAEFRYYILTYMLYARDNYPEVYEGILENDSFRRAFSAVDDTFAGLVEEFRGHPDFYGWADSDYNALKTEMEKTDYVQMAKLLRP